MKTQPSAHSGFTLLEIVVAMAILGIAVGAILQIFSGGMKNIYKIDLAHRAMNHAENVMNEILTDETVRQSTARSGDLDDEFRYEAVVEEWQENRERPTIQGNLPPVRLLNVRVDVYFKNDPNGKFYRTVSMKMVSDQQASPLQQTPTEAIRQLFGPAQ
ncbi:MAG: type II secretion system protein [Acidobacteria bacterium]|nr:type II secretion system protein [Acidobacteriota bacterium]